MYDLHCLEFGSLKLNEEQTVFDVSAPLFKNEPELILYHGTSSVFLQDILNNGLMPREVSGNSVYEGRPNPKYEELMANPLFHDAPEYFEIPPATIESFPDRVYFGDRMRAARAGDRAVHKFGGDLVILRWLLPTADLVADEDSGKETWYESLAWENSVARVGTISSESLQGYYIVPNKFPEHKINEIYTPLQKDPEKITILDATYPNGAAYKAILASASSK